MYNDEEGAKRSSLALVGEVDDHVAGGGACVSGDGGEGDEDAAGSGGGEEDRPVNDKLKLLS